VEDQIKQGFTLFEIIMVLAIIGTLGVAMTSGLRRSDPVQDRKNFVAELNNLMSAAWFNGVTRGAIQRITFNFENNTIFIEQQKASDIRPGKEEVYERVKRAYSSTTLSWPKHFRLKNFFIEGFDEVTKYGEGSEMKKVYFFIMPDGLTQDVTLNIVDMNHKVSARQGTPFSLALNPFSAQFKEHKHFQNIK